MSLAMQEIRKSALETGMREYARITYMYPSDRGINKPTFSMGLQRMRKLIDYCIEKAYACGVNE